MTWIASITTYRLYLRSKLSSPSSWKRFIELHDDQTTVGTITFLADNQNLPGNSEFVVGGRNRGSLYMHEHEYADVVDCLRNEKPLYLVYLSPVYAFIGTATNEPVGENEPSS